MWAQVCDLGPVWLSCGFFKNYCGLWAVEKLLWVVGCEKAERSLVEQVMASRKTIVDLPHLQIDPMCHRHPSHSTLSLSQMTSGPAHQLLPPGHSLQFVHLVIAETLRSASSSLVHGCMSICPLPEGNVPISIPKASERLMAKCNKASTPLSLKSFINLESP